jgi:hypothetical protein
MMAVTMRTCSTCGDERPFERPPCVDGHDDCPELICVDCGSAVVLADLLDVHESRPEGKTPAVASRAA